MSKKASLGSSNLFFEDAEEILIDVAFDHVKAYKINMDYMLLLEFKKEWIMVEQIFLAISYVGLKFKHMFPALAMAFFLQSRVLDKNVGRLALKLSGS